MDLLYLQIIGSRTAIVSRNTQVLRPPRVTDDRWPLQRSQLQDLGLGP